MRAALYDSYQAPLTVCDVHDPDPEPHGVVLQVRATGLCRSDWHGWMGHDSDVTPPHVPGHEFAGEVVATGHQVTRWQTGDRVTLPFVCGCGACGECLSGNHQICDHQVQPGVTQWGAFAEYVAVPWADINLVRLPESLDFVTAASLGCRFVTAYRAVVAQGQVGGGQWVAVHGCGGVGLSAIMIAAALGAQVVAIDIGEDKLALAREIGASVTIDARTSPDVVAAVMEATGGGAHCSLDALGHRVTCYNAIAGLRKRGRHVQVGLMVGEHADPPLPMGLVIARELVLLGSHGMQAHAYPDMLRMIENGRLRPSRLLGRTISLDEAALALPRMDDFSGTGVTVIDRFR